MNAGGEDAEMFIPTILSRMIEADESRRASDDYTRIRSFRDIASQTSKGEIVRSGGTLLFAAADVIHVKGETGVFLMNQAVFANPVSPLKDETAQTG
jgi:hypothetical protein